MLNETMRAVALLALALEGKLREEELEELAFLRIVLERASRATANRPRQELEADASGLPQPEEL